MIELPAGGLKYKIGQKGTLGQYQVFYAPDYCSWSWFFITPMEPNVDRFADLVDVAREFGNEIIPMHRQVCAFPGGAFAVEVPKELESRIKT